MIRKVKNNFLTGFTLIELLLGLVVFSSISLILYRTFAGGVDLNRRSENINRVYREARWTLEQVAMDLENMVAYDFSNSYSELTSLAGSSQKLVFVLPTDEGLKVVTYRLQEPEATHIHKVIVGESRSRPDSIVTRYEEKEKLEYFVREEVSLEDYLLNNSQDAETEVLSSSVKENGLKFVYAKRDNNSSELIWQDFWDEVKFPVGVGVQLTFLMKDQKQKYVTLNRDVLIPTAFFKQEEKIQN